MQEMYSREEVYRPLWEQNSLLLEVSRGCSWRKCAFCYFAQEELHLFSLEEIREKALQLQPYSAGKTRLFLLGENPFVMETPRLLSLLDIVHELLPEIQDVSMYTRADDVLRKNIRELALLRRAGVSRLYMGLESGSDAVLSRMRKGETAAEIIRACHMLTAAGIPFGFSIISGLGGQELSNQHVEETAKVINQTQPSLIWCLGLLLWDGTALMDEYRRGQFHPLNERERLQETFELVKRLELRECIFADTTLLGKYSVIGMLPEQKASMIEGLAELCAKADANGDVNPD